MKDYVAVAALALMFSVAPAVESIRTRAPKLIRIERTIFRVKPAIPAKVKDALFAIRQVASARSVREAILDEQNCVFMR